MILHFEPEPGFQLTREPVARVHSDAGVSGSMSSSLYFWRQIRSLAESKVHALHDSFRKPAADVSAQMDKPARDQETDELAGFRGSPLDAA